jgi:hypothetical protein
MYEIAKANVSSKESALRTRQPYRYSSLFVLTGYPVKRRWSTAGVDPPGNWFAPPGSNQSSSRGNETTEASGAESRQASTRLTAINQIRKEYAETQCVQTNPSDHRLAQVPHSKWGGTVGKPPILHGERRGCRSSAATKMGHKRFGKITAFGAGLIASLVVGIAATGLRAQTVSVQPFVGIQVGEVSPRKEDPPMPRTYFQTIAVRSDGSISRVSKLQHATQVLYVRDVVDATAKTHTSVSPVKESILVRPYNDFQTIGRASCQGTPAGQLQGFDVLYSESTETLKDGSAVNTKEWKAPRLGCYPLVQEWINTRRSGELIGDTKHSLVHVKLGEPDPWYFEIPTNYTARTSEEWTALMMSPLQK